VSLDYNVGKFVDFSMTQIYLQNKKKPDFSSFFSIVYVGKFELLDSCGCRQICSWVT